MEYVINKSYESIFILDSSKLLRIMTIIEERFKSIEIVSIASFEIITKKGKTFYASDIKGILEHDNPIQNPILNLKIYFQDVKEQPNKLCRLVYDKEYSKINIHIESDNMKWGEDLFAELEEQIERSFINNMIYKVKNNRKDVLFFVIFISIVYFSGTYSLYEWATEENIKLDNFLTSSDINRLQIMADNSKNIDDKVEFLYNYNSAQLKNISVKKSVTDNNIIKKIILFSKYLDWKFFVILLPFIIVVFCVIYLFGNCYPGSIFLWGDFIEYHKHILEKRKTLWNTVIFALGIGIVGNLFVFGISKFIF